MAIAVGKIKKRWMKEPGFTEGYGALEDELALASTLITARMNAKLSQAQLATRMGTSQSTVARLESGSAKPSLSTLQRFAKATGTRVRVSLEPKPAGKRRARKAA